MHFVCVSIKWLNVLCKNWIDALYNHLKRPNENEEENEYHYP